MARFPRVAEERVVNTVCSVAEVRRVDLAVGLAEMPGVSPVVIAKRADDVVRAEERADDLEGVDVRFGALS